MKDYWSQLAVILGIFGYIVKTIVSYRIKERQIQFSSLQSLRNKDIKGFYVSVLALEEMLVRHNVRSFNTTNLDSEFYSKMDNVFEQFTLQLSSLKLIINLDFAGKIDTELKRFQELKLLISTCDATIRAGVDNGEARDELNKTYDYLKNEFPQVKKNLERILREINGAN